ncbi:MAG TPA: hypothetical protein VHE35_32070 [Kofleriaceae bacterium]|nr:hypothetical protein [Kofleriaceae bacterium]
MNELDGIADLVAERNARALRHVARRACTAVFARHGHTLRPRSAAGAGARVCGALALEGGALRGCLLLAAPLEAFARMNPLPDVPVTDWIAELTNQVGGRIVNALGERGVKVSRSMPVVMTRGIQPPGTGSPRVLTLAFATAAAAADPIDLCIGADWQPGVVLDDPHRTSPLVAGDQFLLL